MASILAPIAPSTENTKLSYASMSQTDLVKIILAKDKTIKDDLETKQTQKGAPQKGRPGGICGTDPYHGHSWHQTQMKYKPSLKHSKGRWSWSSLCDEDTTFRAFMKIPAAEKKTKGRKIETDSFQEDFLGQWINPSIRYGRLSMTGDTVNVTYTSTGEIKITGSYGL